MTLKLPTPKAEEGEKGPSRVGPAPERAGAQTARDERASSEQTPDLDILYLPREPLTSREPAYRQSSKFSFTRFNDVKKTDAYIKKVNDLTEHLGIVKSLCKRLDYNSHQKSVYLHRMHAASHDCYAQAVDNLNEWERKRLEKIKVLKR